MRNIRKNRLFACLVFLAMVGAGQTAWSQDPPPPTDCPITTDPDQAPDPYCPIDSGLLFLLLTGAGYGIKKFGFNRKNQAIDTTPQN